MDENLKSLDNPSVNLLDRASYLSKIVDENFAHQYASDRAIIKAVNVKQSNLKNMLSPSFIGDIEKREKQSRDIFWENFKKAAGYYALKNSLYDEESKTKLLDNTKKDAKRFIEQYINNDEGKGLENRQILRGVLAGYVDYNPKLTTAIDNPLESIDVLVDTEEELKDKEERKHRTFRVEDFFERNSGRLSYKQCIEKCGFTEDEVD